MMRHSWFAGSLLVLLGAPAHAQRSDTAATKAWLLAADRTLAAAVAERGIEALVHVLTPEAAVLIPGHPVLSGSEAEAPLVARYGGRSRTTWRVAAAVASTDPIFGCTIGVSTFISGGDTLHRERAGDYLLCWRRGPGGSPQLIGFQRDDAPPGARPPASDAPTPAMPHSATEPGGVRALADAQDADAAFARAGGTRAGPGEAFARWIAPDGLFPGDLTGARGPALAQASFAKWPAGAQLLWEPMRSAGYGSGGLAFTVGHAVRRNAGTEADVGRSKYFTVWRLEPDGRWRWIFDLGSPRP